eukprot:1239824-Alexandrium_andersonii.AAC.1
MGIWKPCWEFNRPSHLGGCCSSNSAEAPQSRRSCLLRVDAVRYKREPQHAWSRGESAACRRRRSA